MKGSIWLRLFLLFLVFTLLTSCTTGLVPVTATNQPTQVLEAVPSPSPVKPSVLATATPEPVRISKGDELPQPVLINQSILETPGAYLIYSKPTGYQYVSLDGLKHGDLFPFDNYSHDFREVDGVSYLVLTDYEESMLSLWQTDLQGNLVKSLRISNIQKEGTTCYNSDSPNTHWFIKSCDDETGHSIYLIDTDSEQVTHRYFSEQCEYWDVFIWSNDGSWAATHCQNTRKYCFVSTFPAEVICTSTDWRLVSLSPDGSQVVMYQGFIGGPADGRFSVSYTDLQDTTGIQLWIGSRECFLAQGTNCQQGTVSTLPFYTKVPPLLAYIDFAWDASGTYAAWLVSPLSGGPGIGPGPASVGIIDIKTGTNQIWNQMLPVDTQLASFSPDGEWLLFSDRQGLFIGRVAGNKLVRRLVNTETAFWRWLVVK